MNDKDIRKAFHLKYLKSYHEDKDTLIIDELGLKHGKCVADIAVISRTLKGYEIKSDGDSLTRLYQQVDIYSLIFEYCTLVTTEKHYEKATEIIPDWWGVVLASKGKRGAISFKLFRKALKNQCVDLYSVTQLLWKDEAQEVLEMLGYKDNTLHKNRSYLYSEIVKNVEFTKIKELVKGSLIKRGNWRDHISPYECADLSPLSSK